MYTDHSNHQIELFLQMEGMELDLLLCTRDGARSENLGGHVVMRGCPAAPSTPHFRHPCARDYGYLDGFKLNLRTKYKQLRTCPCLKINTLVNKNL